MGTGRGPGEADGRGEELAIVTFVVCFVPRNMLSAAEGAYKAGGFNQSELHLASRGCHIEL